jgi:hypothetical protein
VEKQYVYEVTLRRVYGLTPKMVQELYPPDLYRETPTTPAGRWPACTASIGSRRGSSRTRSACTRPG